MIKIHLLKYFVVLAEEMHFGRAASRLSISQPPLSAAVKALEEELGVKLLEREGKKFFLTPAGVGFLEDARQILERVASAKESARAIARGMKGSLQIGFTASSIYRLVPEVVSSFNERMPDIDITLREISSTDQLHQLLSGQLDLGFVNVPTVRSDLESLRLPRDTMTCCLPSSHRLASGADVDLLSLRDETFIMPTRDVAPTHYDNIIAVFNQCAMYPRIRHATRQWMSTIALVSKGLGVAIMPSALRLSGVSGATFLPIKNVVAEAPASLVWLKGADRPALHSFVAHAHSVFASEPTD